MKIRLWIFVVISHFVFSQENQLWKGYFSYNEMVDVEGVGSTFFAATENCVFKRDLTLQNVDLYNSVNGFKPQKLTAIHYSESFKKMISGNENGLILVTDKEGETKIKVDIIEEIPVPSNKKRINDFYEHNGKLYIATNYGISVMDLNTSEFVITYFIGPAGEEVEVLQTTVLNNELYAVTRLNGIRKGDLSNPFLFDFNQWQTFDGGYWLGIVTNQNQLVAVNSNNVVYKYEGGGFQSVLNLAQAGKKIKVNNNKITITTDQHVYVMNDVYVLQAHVTSISGFSGNFIAADVASDQLLIATDKKGLYQTALVNPTVFENITPNGPFRNYVFRVKKYPNYLWAVYGDYSAQYNPYPLESFPISKFSTNSGWEDLSFDYLLQARSICDIIQNPNNPTEIFVSSYIDGLLKIDDSGVVLYNQNNTGSNGLEGIPLTVSGSDQSVRVNGLAFDKNNNLWMTNAFVNKAIKTRKNDGQWQSYNLSGITINVGTGRYGLMEVDKNNTKWIPAYNDGVVAFNEQLSNKYILITQSNSSLPDEIVNCLAVDNKNQLWIGTRKGLRVLSNVDRFLNENQLSVNAIIIQEGDLAQELFYQQNIFDIKVDGANRKWVAIEDGGVFLVSSNGQNTIYKFTKDNSPLPSNNVTDIEIDEVTGEVYFATEKGMVSFLGTATKPSEDLASVYVYPNPVRPGFEGTVKIAGLTDKANVKITDIEGNLVYETTSEGGTIEWDTKSFSGYKVASGVYMVFLATDEGTETEVKKIMIVR